jgi:cell division protein ZapD
MAATAHSASTPNIDRKMTEYEQPLSERMRTFMRLEFLYRQMLYNSDYDADWATRAAIASLLEIMAILSRGDIRSDVHKELDTQIGQLEQYRSQPQVDSKRLDTLIGNLLASRNDIDSAGGNFMNTLKDSEFLNAIKHRSTIPGGTCEFDLPEYSHWLRQPFSRRQEDLNAWLSIVRPLCDAVVELLWLIRESAQPQEKVAINGMYQHRMQKDLSCRLLRVSLADDCSLYPEISGSQHRFIIRFLEWSSTENRAVQTGHDIKFHIAMC